MRDRTGQSNRGEESGKIPRVLTIAGSDSGGGAGIQADLKTFTALGVYGMSAITAVTAQNTVGVMAIQEMPPDFVSLQIRAVVEDIGVDAVKTGMLGSAGIIDAVAQTLEELKLKPVIVDPVMRAKGGAPLLQKSAIKPLINRMLPLAEIVTPNRWEAEELSGRCVANLREAREAARAIHALGPRWVIIKGGHLETDLSVDLLYDGQGFIELPAKRYAAKNTHGTGCTFASAIAANMAKGLGTLQAIQEAKVFVTEAIRFGLELGKGKGPVNHLFDIVPGVVPPEE